MRIAPVYTRLSAFTVLESLLMMGLMTLLALVSWAIYLKETDPNRKGPGVWEKVEQPFIPAFHETDEPMIIVPDPPLKDNVGQPD